MLGFDATVFPKLDFRDPAGFHLIVEQIRGFFVQHHGALEPVRVKADAYSRAMTVLDPFIQAYTAKVCPYCGVVCCANQHGFPEFADIVSVLAVGMELPRFDLDVDANAMCQFMGERGCRLPRIQRPYRCTGYFCEPLLVQIEIGPARHYRKFIQDVQGLAAARGRLLEAFFKVWSAKTEDSVP